MNTRLIAHRGGSGLRVENTLAAFAHAIELGAEGAELDVHLSRDGQVVVHHDDALNPAYCRHVDGDWIGADEVLPLSALTYAELQTYEIGTPRPGTDYARRLERIEPVAGQHIPLLRDVIRLAKARSPEFLLVIEIKTPELEAARKPWVQLADATLAVIDAEDFFARSILCSFDWGSLRYVKQRRPDLATWLTSSPLSWFGHAEPPREDIPPDATCLKNLRAAYATGDAPWFAGFDPRRFAGGYPEAVAAAGGNAWFPYHRDFAEQTCRESAIFGLDTAVWSVNLRDPVELARLVRAGVHDLVMDYPDVDLKALAKPVSAGAGLERR
ncbi:MAG TPA: glycerophosphodiester phosphodiesterase family protein [Rhodanobacteraceae bacterium]|nr:glycerophosphodiester phosphodiesterase family protein [Rhodanobacteraceae bacterium]